MCLPSSSCWHSSNLSRICRRKLSEEGEKAEDGSGAGRVVRCGSEGTAVSPVDKLSPVMVAAPRVRGLGWGGGAVPRDRGGRGGGWRRSRAARRRAGMEGRSNRGMKTHKEDEAAGRSCAPPIARSVVRYGDPIC
jgi:hypothetical protein